MSENSRPPITVEYLEGQGSPTVSSPAPGIVMVISGDGYETVDMTAEQARQVADRLNEWAYEVERRH